MLFAKQGLKLDSITLTIGGKKGRIIKIQLEGKSSLYIAEVIVTGKSRTTI